MVCLFFPLLLVGCVCVRARLQKKTSFTHLYVYVNFLKIIVPGVKSELFTVYFVSYFTFYAFRLALRLDWTPVGSVYKKSNQRITYVRVLYVRGALRKSETVCVFFLLLPYVPYYYCDAFTHTNKLKFVAATVSPLQVDSFVYYFNFTV